MSTSGLSTRYRTHTSAELGGAEPGAPVTVCGFMAGRLNPRDPDFDLADSWGRIRISLDPGATAALQVARALSPEDAVQVEGALKGDAPFARGVREVRARRIEVLSRATALPVDPRRDAYEEKTPRRLRMASRHLDLRRPEAQARLRLRSRLSQIIRNTLWDKDFTEIDTPQLGRWLPGMDGAFLVPAPGYAAYALTDTPQLYKQLLMIGGCDRYFQIARCFRDEGRYDASHQPEFSALDLEMAWAGEGDVYRVVDAVMGAIHRKLIGHPMPPRVPRLTFAEALSRFGTDAPDLRFALELAELSDLAARSPSDLVREAAEEADGLTGLVTALKVPGATLADREEGWDSGIPKVLEAYPGVSHGWLTVDGDDLTGPLAHAFEGDAAREVIDRLAAIDGDAVCLIVGNHRPIAQRAAGALRAHLGEALRLIPEGAFAPAWIYEIPYFGYQMHGDLFVPIRHPFTRPADEDREAIDALNAETPQGPEDEDGELGARFGDLLHFYADPAARRRAAIRSQGFELILNGQELATGSIRNHDEATQQAIFDLLRYDPKEVERRFEPLLRAMKAAAPPHGGLSLGLDRLAALLAGVDDVREVMAFPKDEAGRCPLTGAPGAIPAADLHALLGAEATAPASEATDIPEDAGPPPARRPSPAAAFSFSPAEVEAGAPVTLVDRSESLRPISAWLWECPELSWRSGERAPALSFPGPGDYQLILTVTDSDGRQASAGAMVLIPADEVDADGVDG